MNMHYDVVKGLTGKLYVEFTVQKQFSDQVFSNITERLFDDTPDRIMDAEFIEEQLIAFADYVFENIPMIESERQEFIKFNEEVAKQFEQFHGLTYKEFTEQLKGNE